MYLSDRDLIWAIQRGQLIVDPPPVEGSTKVGSTSIDLHLDRIEEAKIWNIPRIKEHNRVHGYGNQPELHLGSFEYKQFAGEYLIPPPVGTEETPADVLVYRDGSRVVVRPRGFLLWQTREKVGTPEEGAQLICFVDGKSTLARTGLVVHLTAPTIHAAWGAWPVTLEIANLGPFHFVLKAGDAIAQLTVAKISSTPQRSMRQAGSTTVGQGEVGSAPKET